MRRVFSGIQPSGNLHLGNYLGAIRQGFSQGIDVAGVDRLIVRHKVSIIQFLPEAYESRIEQIEGVEDAVHLAEDLAAYLNEQNVACKWLHSELDAFERVELLRDLRSGRFEALVGVNLLREGLDLPEVSLVAILDADKEGFLRSDRSLIQTIGRAARNANGKAILYADRITGSMERAIGETERRRARQVAYNEAHGITPQTIRKAVADVMEGAYAGHVPSARKYAKVAEEVVEYAGLSPEMLNQKLKKLEKQMYQHAQNLEFEEAARVRDQIRHIQEGNLGLAERGVG